MQRFILAPLLLILLLTSCSNSKKYNSYREAKDSCKEWAIKGGTYELKNPKEVIPETTNYQGKVIPETILDEETYRIPLRWCDDEPATNQVLGLRISKRKKDEKMIYTNRCRSSSCDEISSYEKKNSKVEANFYY